MKHELYHTWQSMKQRCLNPNTEWYHRYGGRGITVCDEWLHSFETFLKDVGAKPKPNYSLDRIDVNGNYTKDNVRWVNDFVQMMNRRSHIGKYKGVSFYKIHKKYASAVYIKDKHLHIGMYLTEEEAANAYNKAVSLLFEKTDKTFVHLNELPFIDVEIKNISKEASTKAEEAKQLLRQRRFEDIKSNQDKEKDTIKTRMLIRKKPKNGKKTISNK